jgi:hypothetical protein
MGPEKMFCSFYLLKINKIVKKAQQPLKQGKKSTNLIFFIYFSQQQI